MPSLRVDSQLRDAAQSVRAEFVARGLASREAAQTTGVYYAAGDVHAERALNAITTAVDRLGRSPFIYRKAGQSPFLRELLIPFGHSDCVALFEIENASTVTILAVRHQLEDDYH